MSYSWSGCDSIDMASVTDGLTHAIADADLDAGILQGQGCYSASCGAQVLAAPLAAQPGPLCPSCSRRPARAQRTNRVERLLFSMIAAVCGLVHTGSAGAAPSPPPTDPEPHDGLRPRDPRLDRRGLRRDGG